MKKLLITLILVLLMACTPSTPLILSTPTALVANVPSQYSTIQRCVDSAKVCNVAAGTYTGTIKITKSGVTLQAVGKVLIKGAIMIYGADNVVRGFTITHKQEKAGIRLYGNHNTAENNEIYDTLEDGIWFWGTNHVIKNNYIHDIYDDRNWPATDNHVDCFMVMDWEPGTTDNILFEGNTCIHLRNHGSNQGAMIDEATNLTFRNNVFVFADGADGGYSPAFALFSGSGFTLENNYVCNTTGQGESVGWFEGVSNVRMTGNRWAGYRSLYKGGVVPVVNSGNVKGSLPCGSVTPTRISTPVPIQTATPTQTKMPTSVIVVVGGTDVICQLPCSITVR